MTRLIDADNFSNVFNSKIFNKLQNEYLNSTADDKTKDVADFVTADIMTAFNDLIDNAPTVERPQNCFTRQDLQDWLYQIMFNNIGTNFELACEELIERLDGFERFVADRRKEGR